MKVHSVLLSLLDPCLRPSQMRRFIVHALTICLFAFIPSLSHAQFETASVLGFVNDSTGAAVANSKVTLTDLATGVAKTVSSDSQGQYQFTDVHIGKYKIAVEAAGFSSASTQPFSVTVNARQRVDVTLIPGGVAETVTVNGGVAQLETETSETGTVGP